MTTKITEPNVDRANLEGWETVILRTTKQGGGSLSWQEAR